MPYLTYKHDKKKHLCTNGFCNNIDNLEPTHEYTETVFDTLEELLEYALNMNEDVEIPEDYNVTKIYNIVFSTANFDPLNRECSTTDSHVIYSSKDKEFIDKMFERYINEHENLLKQNSKAFHMRPNSRRNKNWYCWHTEDFAYNQVIHSYSKRESYIIERKNINEQRIT